MLINGLQFGFLGLGLVLLVAAFLMRNKRGALAVAAIFSLIAGLSARYDAFWSLLIFGSLVPWALIVAGNTVDAAWRMKMGLVAFVGVISAFCFYPSYFDQRCKTHPDDPACDKREEASLSPDALAERIRQAKRGELGFSKFLRSNIDFRLVRGLDLEGGLRLVYTVEVEEAIKDKRDRYYDDLRVGLTQLFEFSPKDAAPSREALQKLAEKARVEKPRSEVATLRIFLNSAEDAPKLNEEFFKKFSELNRIWSADRKSVTLTLGRDVETGIRDRAVAQAKETVLRRVDALGLKEAGVSVRDEDIIVEVPGDDERQFAEIREIISQTARLEFKLLDDEANFFEPYTRATEESTLPSGLTFSLENAPIGPNKTKPNYYARLVKADGEDMRSALKRMREWAATLQVPEDHEIGFGKLVEFDEEKNAITEIGWRTYYLYSKAEVTGDMVRDAQAMSSPDTQGMSGWHVSLEFTPLGGERFEEITGKNVKRRFAIILDSKVESSPVIQTKIAGGRAQISMGSGSVDQQLEDARKLELVLRSGALPAPIVPSYEQRIGPSLGKDAIDQGVKAGLLGAILVLAFMVLYYNRAGMIANIAVMFNLFLQLAVLAMFGASMTLPGIAGLVLTIGIAVDANVLINERIRDELRLGKSPRTAVDIGYDKAFGAILDGHVTGIISGLILAQYGSGPIKGFAVTLLVGIVISLFTGVVCTRLMFDWAVRERRVQKLHLG